MFMPAIFKNDLFDDFFDDFGGYKRRPPMGAVTVMRTDVKETENAYELEIELPGCSKENVSAELKEGYLTIKAEIKSEEENEKKAQYLRRERFFGVCSRSFYVGEALTEEDITARFENGILKLNIPKKQPEAKIPERKLIAIQ